MHAIYPFIAGFAIIYVLWDWYIISKSKDKPEDGDEYSDCVSLYAV